MSVRELDFLAALTEALSPSGYEEAAARVFREHLRPTADTLETSVLGSVHALLKGRQADGLSVLLAGHIDQVGFQVAYISEEGFLNLVPVGDIDPAVLPGKRLEVHTASGLLYGVIGRKPVHIYEYEEEAYPKTIPLHELFLDVGLDGDEARRRIAIGDPVVYGTRFTEFGDGLAYAQAFDDKVGAWLTARVLEEVKAAGGAAGDVWAVGTVQEEICYRGGQTSAYAIDPDLSITLEVGGTQDHPFADKKFGRDFKLGQGPIIARGPNVNPVLFDLLVAAAKKEDVPYQVAAMPFADGTDASVIQLIKGGKPTALVSVPLRYMHTPVEVIDLKDLDRTVQLLTRFILDLDPATDFTPTLANRKERS
ncbi:MAG: M20/M25/M40 family metallo-hydrolase [Coriobacteriales bacterium]|jgi:endoglucanase|nr:M20/M25/M40 family metallo-hydrolase [Coriobacteriales bacterium]